MVCWLYDITSLPKHQWCFAANGNSKLKKMPTCWLRFHWNRLLRFKNPNGSQCGFGYCLAANCSQVRYNAVQYWHDAATQWQQQNVNKTLNSQKISTYHPHWWPMGCLLWAFWSKSIVLNRHYISTANCKSQINVIMDERKWPPFLWHLGIHLLVTPWPFRPKRVLSLLASACLSVCLSFCLSLCPSVAMSVRKFYVSRAKTRHRFVLESPDVSWNLHQTCLVGYSRLVLKMLFVDFDLGGHMAIWVQNSRKFGLLVRKRFKALG